jgi:copper resistance protein C
VRRKTAVVFGLLAMSEPGLAHSLLLSSLPAAGSTVAAPSHLKFSFSGAVEPGLTGANLKCSGSDIAPIGKAAISPDNRVVEIALPMLPKGLCIVYWHAVSVDGHRIKGEFGFTVR